MDTPQRVAPSPCFSILGHGPRPRPCRGIRNTASHQSGGTEASSESSGVSQRVIGGENLQGNTYWVNFLKISFLLWNNFRFEKHSQSSSESLLRWPSPPPQRLSPPQCICQDGGMALAVTAQRSPGPTCSSAVLPLMPLGDHRPATETGVRGVGPIRSHVGISAASALPWPSRFWPSSSSSCSFS